MARAIWKGRLCLGREELPVKLYSAASDTTVHFRLLHAKDREPVEQRIVRKSDGKEVDPSDRRKAFAVDKSTLVIIQPDELDALEPKASRAIEIYRFIPAAALSDLWYDRPYYVGPDRNAGDYFALADAIGERIGIARWTMRKTRYAGALLAYGGYLMLISLRRADQILKVTNAEPPASRQPDPKELRLAAQLVASIAGDFAPQQWHDDHRKRICELIEAKARGKTIELPAPRKRASGGGLSEQLQQSLAQAKRSSHAEAR